MRKIDILEEHMKNIERRLDLLEQAERVREYTVPPQGPHCTHTGKWGERYDAFNCPACRTRRFLQ